jgi:hypothetical protein
MKLFAYILAACLSCTAMAATTPLGETDKAAIERSVRNLTEEYFRGIDDLEFASSYAKLAPVMQKMKLYDDWRSGMEDFRSMSGALQEANVWRITVYVDPPNAPGPGVYVAADFENEYEKVPFQCGYLIWFEGPAGVFQVIREETGHLDRETAAKLSKSDMRQVRATFGCPPSGN